MMRPTTLCATGVLLVSLAGSSTATAQQPGPPIPYEDFGVCPREYCAYGEWTALRTVKVYRTRSLKSTVAFTVKTHDKISALTGVVVTYSPSAWHLSHDTQLGNLSAKAGETLYLLTYHGEAMWTVWFRGRLYDDIDCSMCDIDFCDIDWLYFCSDTQFTAAVRTPKRIWWAQIKTAKGPIGWAAISPGDFDLGIGPDRTG
jgi:hypothetical protein